MGATLRCGAWASHCSGFSCCRARALGAWASVVVACGLQQLWLTGCRAQPQWFWRMGLVAPRHVGSSQTRARTHVPCIGRRILNHCATPPGKPRCWASFQVLLAICILWRNVYSNPLPIFKLSYLSFYHRVMSSLYNLNTRPLSGIWFANTLSHSVGFLFTFFMVYFEAQKFLLWWGAIYSFLLLLLMFLVSYVRNHCLIQGHEDLSLCFLLRVL